MTSRTVGLTVRGMADQIVDYEELTTAADRCTSTGQSMKSELDSLKSHIEGLGWVGASSAAFQELFANMYASMSQIEEQLAGVGTMLTSAASTLGDADSSLASSIRGGG